MSNTKIFLITLGSSLAAGAALSHLKHRHDAKRAEQNLLTRRVKFAAFMERAEAVIESYDHGRSSLLVIQDDNPS